jgi:hypothetical protein
VSLDKLKTLLIQGLGHSKFYTDLPFVEMETARDVVKVFDPYRPVDYQFQLKPVSLLSFSLEELLNMDTAESSNLVRGAFDSMYQNLAPTEPITLDQKRFFSAPPLVIGMLIPFFCLKTDGASRLACFMDVYNEKTQ